jgi:hypothetical protein
MALRVPLAAPAAAQVQQLGRLRRDGQRARQLVDRVRLLALAAHVDADHRYDTPELTAVPISDGSPRLSRLGVRGDRRRLTADPPAQRPHDAGSHLSASELTTASVSRRPPWTSAPEYTVTSIPNEAPARCMARSRSGSRITLPLAR